MWKCRNYYIDMNNPDNELSKLKYEMSVDFYSRYLKPTAAQSSNKMFAWFIYVGEMIAKADTSMKK